MADVKGMLVEYVADPGYAAVVLPRETLDELRWRRAEVGCVGPWWSTPSSMAADAALEAVEATEAECARSAESSRVRRFTYSD